MEFKAYSPTWRNHVLDICLRGGSPIRRTYCAFWKKDNGNKQIEPFARLLKEQFA